MTSDERKAWVKSLKVGDAVVLSTHADRIGTVQSTARGCPVVNGFTFSREGYDRSDTWHPRSIEPLTQEKRDKINAEVRRQNAIHRLNSIHWSEQSDETLRAVLTTLDAGKVQP